MSCDLLPMVLAKELHAIFESSPFTPLQLQDEPLCGAASLCVPWHSEGKEPAGNSVNYGIYHVSPAKIAAVQKLGWFASAFLSHSPLTFYVSFLFILNCIPAF